VASVNPVPGYSSTTNSNYAVSGNSGDFSVDITHARGGAFLSQAYSQANVIFTVSEDSTYTAAGNYANTDGHTSLESFLFDAGDVYRSKQENFGGPISFVLGGSAGNVTPIATGSLTGMLLAGHLYQWSATAYTSADAGTDLGATANGSISFTIRAVPEAGSLAVWSLLMASGCGAVWWRRR
jgi:hypothetical protein